MSTGLIRYVFNLDFTSLGFVLVGSIVVIIIIIFRIGVVRVGMRVRMRRCAGSIEGLGSVWAGTLGSIICDPKVRQADTKNSR